MYHHSFRRYLLAVLVCVPLAGRAAHAQVVPGDRIRILQQKLPITEGVYFQRDSLGYGVLLVGGDTIRVPMDGSYAVERYAGREPNGMRAFTQSVATGAAAGLSLVALALVSPNGEGKFFAVVLAGFATSCFTAIGAVVGAIMSNGDHDVWQRVTFIPADGSATRAQWRTRSFAPAVDVQIRSPAATDVERLPPDSTRSP